MRACTRCGTFVSGGDVFCEDCQLRGDLETIRKDKARMRRNNAWTGAFISLFALPLSIFLFVYGLIFCAVSVVICGIELGRLLSESRRTALVPYVWSTAIASVVGVLLGSIGLVLFVASQLLNP
jgi:hypothetical protein